MKYTSSHMKYTSSHKKYTCGHKKHTSTSKVISVKYHSWANCKAVIRKGKSRTWLTEEDMIALC